MTGKDIKEINNLIKVKNYSLAKLKLEDLLSQDPQNKILRFEYGRVLSRCGSVANDEEIKYLIKANEYLIKLNEEYPTDIYVLLELARLKEKENNLLEARKYLKQILVLKQRDVFCRIELGKLESKLGNKSIAKSYFISVLELDNNNVHALLELGIIESNQKHYDIAKKYFNRVLSINPKDKYAILELSKIEIKNDNYEKAKECLTSVGDKDTEDVFIIMKLGEIELLKKNYDCSIAYYDKALIMRPYNITVICKLILLNLIVNNIQKSKELFERLMNMDKKKLIQCKDTIIDLKWDIILMDINPESKKYEYSKRIIEFSEKFNK